MRSCALLVGILGALVTSAHPAADETAEPPLELTVFVNGTPHSAEFGRELKLTGEFTNPTIVVHPATTRRFDKGGVAFEYPANFTWEADVTGDAYRCWTLSGNNSVIMYFAVAVEFTPSKLADSTVAQYGENNATVTPFNRKLGTRDLQGRRIVAKVAGVELVQDVLAVPAPAGQWRVLVLQDIAPERTPELEEPKRTLDLLVKSFELTE